MKIQAIQIEGFIGLKSLNIDPVTGLTLVAGFNETGKTSLVQALAMAMTGLPERVKLKKDYGELVHDACDEAHVSVRTDADQRLLRIVKKNGTCDGAPNPKNVSETLHCALDMRYFANLEPAAKRRLLFAMSKTSSNVEKVQDLLQEAGAPRAKVDKLKSILLGGFDAGAKAAKEYAADARKDWKRITNEVYGSDKAGSWEATVHPGPANMDHLSGQSRSLKERIGEIDYRLNEARASHDQRAKIEQQLAACPAQEESLEELRAGQQEQTKIALKAEDRLAELGKLKEQLATGDLPEPLMCPDCQTQLVLEDGELVPYEEPEVDQDMINEVEEDITEQHALLQQAKEAVAALDREIAALQKHDDLSQLLASLPDIAVDTKALEEEREHLRTEQQGVDTQIQEAIAIQRQNEQAAKDTEAAKRLHQDVQDWAQIEKLLLPDGIPKTLMANALDPINLCLQEQANMSGWGQVAIDENMVVTYGEQARAYYLLSESVQWRVQAMLSMAISYLAGIGFIVLDRADVLDLAGRGQMFQWAKAMTDKDMQTIVCATLKQKPAIEDESVTVIWLGGSL